MAAFRRSEPTQAARSQRRKENAEQQDSRGSRLILFFPLILSACCFHLHFRRRHLPFLNRRLGFSKCPTNRDHNIIPKPQQHSRVMEGFIARAAEASTPQLEDADALIDSVETFIFDCDGIITFSWSFILNSHN
ncbi:unnamed protein product [Linum trigynum]|uniref:Uncharacterized protein n=1 Tax=Linum trigynum TaxID=586398 RepID=A0AAV2D9A6_9ROSI